METSTKRSTQHKRWEEIIAEQEASGLSRAEFCRKKNLSKSNFSYYAAKLSVKNSGNAKIKNKFEQLFSTVSIKKPELTLSEIKIILPNGFHCVVPSTIEIIQVRKLVEALLSC